MKKVSKILSIALIVVIMVAISTTVFAVSTPSGVNGESDVNTASIDNLGNALVKIISTVGIFASVIMLVILGVKYMMGSAEEKAEYKKTLLPYVIGASLVFAASAIAQIVFNFANSFTA